MTIDDAREKKAQLEQDIADALEAFTNATGMIAGPVEIKNIDLTSAHGQTRAVYKISVGVKL